MLMLKTRYKRGGIDEECLCEIAFLGQCGIDMGDDQR
jgi:hypothetical protein